MSKKYLGLFFLLGAVLCWGPAPVASKLALNQVPQLSFAFASRFLALIIITILYFRKGAFKIKREDLPMLIVAGLAGALS